MKNGIYLTCRKVMFVIINLCIFIYTHFMLQKQMLVTIRLSLLQTKETQTAVLLYFLYHLSIIYIHSAMYHDSSINICVALGTIHNLFLGEGNLGDWTSLTKTVLGRESNFPLNLSKLKQNK